MKSSKLFAIIFFTLGILANLFFTTYSANLSKKALKEQIDDNLKNTAQSETQQIESFLEAQNKIFDQTKDDELFIKFLKSSSEDENYLQTFTKVMETLDSSNAASVGILNSDGIIVANKDRSLIGWDFSVSPGFERSLEEEKVYAIFPGNNISGVRLGLTTPIKDKSGKTLGVYGMRFPLDDLKSILGSLDKLGKTAESYLIDKNLLMLTPSRFLTGANKGVLIQEIDTANSQNCFDVSAPSYIHKNEPIISFLDYRGEEVFGTHQEIKGVNWCLLIEVDKSELLNVPLKTITKNTIIALTPLIFILTLIGFFIGKYFDKKNSGKKISRYPCGIKRKFQPWYCRLMQGNCATYPNGRCGKVIKTRKFFTNLKLRYYFLLALIFTIGCFFLITSFFQGWQNAAFHNEISDLFATFVLILFFFYGFKLKSQPAKKLIIFGSTLSIISKLTQIILEEYILKFGVIPISYWIPGTILSLIGFFLIFFGFKEVAK